VARKADIDGALGGQSVLYVASDPALAAEAANTGRPMTQIAPRRAVNKNIRRIGQWIDSIRTPKSR
jgi:Flp pilus assembly CpaE family ATPase